MDDLIKPSFLDRARAAPGRLWRENRRFLLLLLCIFFFKSAVADLSSVSGASMRPTLLDGDKVWVNKLAYDVKVPFTEISLAEVSPPRRGDVVIIDSSRAGKRLVKRIIGVPGDALHIQNGALVINGRPADYQVLSRDDESVVILERLPETAHRARLDNRYVSRAGRSFGPVVVPAGQYFVLGDNRDNSADSRVYSFVPRGEIIGRSRAVVLSLDRRNWFLPRGGRFLEGID